MQQNTDNSKTGFGFIFAVTAVLVLLKLTGIVGWAWWVVLSPLWITVGLVVVVAIIYMIADLIKAFRG